MVNYGLKIPANSFGSYSSLISDSKTFEKNTIFFLTTPHTIVSAEANQQTSVCRVDISPSRGINVPCSNDVSSVFAYNTNGISSQSTTNLGMICSVACKSVC